jgi:type III restriction enzyme
LVATPDLCFTFDPEEYPYPPNSLFVGRHKFKKHYYKVIGDMKAEGEEFQCAQLLDNHPKIRRWVRNLEGRPQHSFWLQTSTDRFYPDFVCELTDGRYLVVEYKGFDRWSDDDSKEKRAIGQVWEEKSDGQCLFVMPKGPDWNAILAKLG